MEPTWTSLTEVLCATASQMGVVQDIDDLAQEAICKMVEKYSPETWNQELTDQPSQRAFGLAREICRNLVRDKHRQRNRANVVRCDLATVEWNSSTCVADASRDAHLNDFDCSSMPYLHREVISLRLAGVKVSEIAERLHSPIGTVKSILSRARQKARRRSA